MNKLKKIKPKKIIITTIGYEFELRKQIESYNLNSEIISQKDVL